MRACRRFGAAIDVNPDDRPGHMLWRLFVRAPRETQSTRQVRALRAIAAPCLRALRRLSRGSGTPNRSDAAATPVADGLFSALYTERRLVHALLLVVGLIAIGFIATTPMEWTQQLWFSGGLFALAVLLRKRSGRAVTLVLISLSLIATARYFWWRVNYSLDLGSPMELVLGWGLFLAECYALAILLLSFIQSAWPLKRRPVALPADSADWPSVDIFIPTYNEPIDVVRPTVLAALNLDWPADKLTIYLLDDGRRDAFRELAEAAGVVYMTRPDNKHAKAGNLNHALAQSQGEFIAIFDCDHVPVRSFLTTTMGWMLADPKCALVQTPHHFFSPDPMERNLGTFRRVPNEGRLFYGLIQDGNDLWNATFFCGSCAVLRRGPLEEVGGIAVETVTEDAHTSLKMHRRGYNSVYINQVLAAGLATESLAAHIGQRIRWARGMTQIFSADNPLLRRGLSWYQRLCYSTSMLHFLHGVPRLIFLTAPLAYLYFGWHVFDAEAIAIAAFAVPHLVQAVIANSHMQGRFRHSYWAEVYESLLAWYIALPTTLALINPRFGRFNVTAKGGQVSRSYFDWRISLPFLVLMALGLVGFLIGIARLVFGPGGEAATILLNLAWTGYNLIILGAAVGVARENRQLRRTHRVDWHDPVHLILPDGRTVSAESRDFSLGGMHLALDEPLALSRGDAVEIILPLGPPNVRFPARVISEGTHLRLAFDQLDLIQQRALVAATFSRPDAWEHWDDPAEVDRPLASLREILVFGIKGYGLLFRPLLSLTRRMRPVRPTATDTH
ncbi:UDP-forming cellulose synthase catalytic subunit [Algiphilus sp.]|uniref:UDP-forming cellulose synthase catalytic subunit n=1 Tax=Algiphilus sp. TaxID=1872431 RepID=UPI003B522BD7